MFKAGPPVTGDDFIGREEYINTIVRYMKDNKSMSIFGLAKIGKSSIVDETIRRIENDTIKFADSTPLFFKFCFTRDNRDRIHLFKELFRFLEKYIKENDLSSDPELKEYMSRIEEDIENNDISYRPFKDTAIGVYKRRKRTLWLVLDEMDYANESLGVYIDKIRELINQSQDCVRAINISRHTLASIFPLGIPGSNYPGIISESISVVGFNNSDMNLFKQRAKQFLGEISEYEWSIITYYSGNFPILLSDSINILIDYPDCNLEEYPERFINKTEMYFKYWIDSLYGLKLIDTLNDYLDEKRVELRLLRLYGLIFEEKLSIPYLKSYILSLDNYQADDLLDEYLQLLPDIDSLVELGKSLNVKLIGVDDFNRKKLQSGVNDLMAMRTKIDCLQKLRSFSSFVKLDMSTDEYNSFIQREQEIRHLIGSISLR